MKNTWLLAGFVFLVTKGFPQYPGGNGDGFHSLSTGMETMNDQLLYCAGGNNDGFFHISTGNTNIAYPYHCLGGNNDGFDKTSLSDNMFDPALSFSGGNNDGFSFNSTGNAYINSPSVYVSGGNGDGFDVLPDTAYMFNSAVFTGGSNDGFAMIPFAGSIFEQNFYCLGGNNDGFSQLQIPVTHFGRGIWLGMTGNLWNDASNWKGNAVPDITTDVFIPSGCLYYPRITSGNLTIASTGGNYICNSLAIDHGASLYNDSCMFAYGNVTVSGLYQADNDINNAIVLYPGSNLHLTFTGLLKIGNQSNGSTGSSDMRIDGGQLNITGGILEIDDQFNLMAGNFMMTSGTLFVHKFASGTAYSAAAPGAFYIASTATGNISGGTVKVVGRPSHNDSVAVKINSPFISFTGSSTLEFTQGNTARTDDVEAKTVEGVELNNLHVNAQLRKVNIGSDVVFNGTITVEPASSLVILPGNTVTVDDSPP